MQTTVKPGRPVRRINKRGNTMPEDGLKSAKKLHKQKKMKKGEPPLDDYEDYLYEYEDEEDESPENYF